MKHAITVIAFVVMNGAAFLGYRATASPASDTVEKTAPSAARAPSRGESAAPADPPANTPPAAPPDAAAIEVRAIADHESDDSAPDANAIEPADVDVDDSSGDGAKTPTQDSSQVARKRVRGGDPRRAVRSRDVAETRGAVETTTAPPRTTPPAAQPPATPPPAATDDKKRLLDEMESNPYKRSD